MSSLIDQLAEQLAIDTMAYVERTGDNDIIAMISDILLERSQTLQEQFVKTTRVIIAEKAARKLLDEMKKGHDL